MKCCTHLSILKKPISSVNKDRFVGNSVACETFIVNLQKLMIGNGCINFPEFYVCRSAHPGQFKLYVPVHSFRINQVR